MNIFKIIFLSLFFAVMQNYSFAAKTVNVDMSQKYRLEGYKAQKKGDLERAIMCYKKAIYEDSSYAAPYNDLGIIYEEKGLYDSAERSYLKAVKNNSKYAAAYTNLAYLSENKGDIDKAIYYWKKRISVSDDDSKWINRGKEKIKELERRKEIISNDHNMRNEKTKATVYEKKTKKNFRGWKREAKPKDIPEDLSQKYFKQGLEYYNKKEYDKALGAFDMARNYNRHNKEISKYILKVQKIRKALDEAGIPGDSEYKGLVSSEDLMISKDHFKMGLDFYASGEYERAYSSFTMSMTYNPYDEVIKKYVNEAKIKIEEEKVRKKKLKESAKRRLAVTVREPSDIRKEMIKEKQDIVNKGFLHTTEDMSVEGFVDDGKELFRRNRYEDAIYVWRQAILLDVEGIYHDEIESLINQARLKSAEYESRRIDALADSLQEEKMLNVNRAAIPTKAGSTAWNFNTKMVDFENEEMISEDKKNILKKLEERYTLHFKDANLKGIVDLLAELTGMNIVVDTKEIAKDEIEKKNITFKVKEMPLMEIIKAVLRFTDYDYLIENNMIWITTKEKINKEDMRLIVYNVSDIIGKVFDFPAEELGQQGFKQGSSGGLGGSDNNSSSASFSGSTGNI